MLWIFVILVASPGSAKNTSVMSMLMNSWNSAGRLSKLATASDSSGLGEISWDASKSYLFWSRFDLEFHVTASPSHSVRVLCIMIVVSSWTAFCVHIWKLVKCPLLTLWSPVIHSFRKTCVEMVSPSDALLQRTIRLYETAGGFSKDVAYLFNFTVRLNAGKPERLFSKYSLRFLCHRIQKISPQVGYLVVLLHIEGWLAALVLIFLVHIHIGGWDREIVLRNNCFN